MTAAPAAAALALCDAMPGYLVEGKIGEGTFGEVFLIRHTRRRTAVFALKRSKPGRDGDFGGLTPSAVREAALLSALRHANIVRLEKAHVNHDDGSLSLVFDFAEYDLHDIITHHARLGDGPPPPFLVKSVVWQMLQGVAFLHSHRLVHRDLKPSNILLMGPDSREPGCVKIADFGLARSLRAPLRPLADNGVVVTIWYRAPELLLGARHYDEAIDTWAAGAILGECLSGRALFKGVEAKGPGNPFQLDQLRRIFAALGPPREADWPELAYLPYWIQNREGVRELQPQDATSGFEDRGGHLPAPGSAARDLLLRLVAYAPAARLTPAAALRHPWFEEAPPPSANALLGPAGERAGPYPRRVPESAARAKRKAEEAPPPQQQPHQLPAPPRGAPTRRDSQPARQLPHASAYQWD